MALTKDLPLKADERGLHNNALVLHHDSGLTFNRVDEFYKELIPLAVCLISKVRKQFPERSHDSNHTLTF